MNTIQYQILRYLPDRVSGEFVNIGVVAYDPSSRSLESEFIYLPERILSFFPGVDGVYLIKLVRTIKKHLDELASSWRSETKQHENSSIQTITGAVLPMDDSSLIFSEVKSTLDATAKTTVSDVFARLIVSK